MKRPKKLTRREFMSAAGGTIVSIGMPGVFIKVLNGSRELSFPPLMSRDIMRVQDTATALILGRKNGSISYLFGNLKMNGIPINPMAALIK